MKKSSEVVEINPPGAAMAFSPCVLARAGIDLGNTHSQSQADTVSQFDPGADVSPITCHQIWPYRQNRYYGSGRPRFHPTRQTRCCTGLFAIIKDGLIRRSIIGIDDRPVIGR